MIFPIAIATDKILFTIHGWIISLVEGHLIAADNTKNISQKTKMILKAINNADTILATTSPVTINLGYISHRKRVAANTRKTMDMVASPRKIL